MSRIGALLLAVAVVAVMVLAAKLAEKAEQIDVPTPTVSAS